MDEYAGYRRGSLEDVVRQAKNSDYSYAVATAFENNSHVFHLIELLSFHDFIQLFDVYSHNHHNEYAFECEVMSAARRLRNASAHNQSLLHNLNPQCNTYQYQRSGQLATYLDDKLHLNNAVINRLLSVPLLHDLIASLVLLSHYASPAILDYRLSDFTRFLDYCSSRRDVYAKQQQLTRQFESLRILHDQLRRVHQLEV